MRDTAQYEAYLRPILQRLKQIDGRAPVSIMTCSVKPDDPRLQTWIDEGLSIEVHTIDHPCPLLNGEQKTEGQKARDDVSTAEGKTKGAEVPSLAPAPLTAQPLKKYLRPLCGSAQSDPRKFAGCVPHAMLRFTQHGEPAFLFRDL
jgi:hypothetical protein